MYKTFQTNDGVTVTVQTRAGGDVRLSLDHPSVNVMCRAEMRPELAVEIAQSLLNAGATGAMVQFSTGEGGQVASPQRAAGRIRWDLLAVIAGNAVAWGAFVTMCAVASGWRP